MTTSKSSATLAALLIVPFVGPFVAPHAASAGDASSCHFHGTTPAPEKTVLACSAKRIDVLVAKGKVDAAWKGKPHESIEVVDGTKGKEWKVTFADPQAKDAAKSKLYLFFSHTGNFIAANHSGK